MIGGRLVDLIMVLFSIILDCFGSLLNVVNSTLTLVLDFSLKICKVTMDCVSGLTTSWNR